MTKQELRDFLAQATQEFVETGGQIQKRKRAVWAQGAKLKRAKSVAKKHATYMRDFSGPLGMTQMDYQKAYEMSGPYNGVKANL